VLRSFRLGNHRSFHDEQELLLMPAREKGRVALPVAAIYGANASGKSNLLDGLRFMSAAVRDSFAVWSPDEGIPRRPFKLAPDARGKPSIFVAEFVDEGVRYTYGFEIDNDRVLAEWLYSYPARRKRVLFERDGDAVKFGSTIDSAHGKLEVLEGLLRPNALFLSLAAQSNLGFLLPAYRWFTSRLVFRLDTEASVDEVSVGDFIVRNPALHDRLVELLRAADFGISGVFVGRRRPAAARWDSEQKSLFDVGEVMQPPNLTQFAEPHLLSAFFFGEAAEATPRARSDRRIRLSHGDSALFELADESAGTKSWLGLLPIVLELLRGGGTLVIDEIDASLHSLLTIRLVALFNSLETNPGGGQLIFTTHDATLLHPPLAEEVLDRDEVWFVEKGEEGASVLYPLTDFKPRAEDNLERRYLAGRYGAVPELYEERFMNAVRDIGTDAGA
jgi:uncharacterized protein